MSFRERDHMTHCEAPHWCVHPQSHRGQPERERYGEKDSERANQRVEDPWHRDPVVVVSEW